MVWVLDLFRGRVDVFNFNNHPRPPKLPNTESTFEEVTQLDHKNLPGPIQKTIYSEQVFKEQTQIEKLTVRT